MLYTIVASAARHDLDVWAYLRDVLERLAEWAQQTGGSPPSPDQLTTLLPDVWAKSHPESLRSYRQHERENRAAAQRNRHQKRRALAQAQSANQPNG